MLIVFRLPAVDGNRRVFAHRVGRQPVFERGEIDEGLERRAGLALGGDGAIELALGVALAADQRAHDAVRRHRDQRTLADAEFFALLRQRIGQGMFGRVLQRRIDRSLDHNVLIEAADEVVDRVHHPVGHVIDRAGAGRFYRARGIGERQPRGVVADEFLLRHVGEHEARAALGAVRVMARRQPRRRLHETGQHRGFGQRQLPRRFAEIALGGGFHAVGAGAEIDAVEIEFENLLPW